MSLARRLVVVFEMGLGLVLMFMDKYDQAQIALLFAILLCVLPTTERERDYVDS